MTVIVARTITLVTVSNLFHNVSLTDIIKNNEQLNCISYEYDVNLLKENDSAEWENKYSSLMLNFVP